MNHETALTLAALILTAPHLPARLGVPTGLLLAIVGLGISVMKWL